MGFVFGIVVLNFASHFFMDSTGLLDEYTLGRIKYLEINKENYFIYILKKRVSTLWALVFFSSAFWGIVVIYGYIFWMGSAMGIILSAAIVRYGIKGILLIIVGVFPQIFIYVPLTVVCFYFCYNVWETFYSSNVKEFQYGLRRKQRVAKWLVQFLILNVVVIMGGIIESYVNPIFVTKVLSIF